VSRRTQRVAEQLRAEIARVLREEVTDPRIGLVTLTRVDVSPDLANALVFWSALGVEGADSSERERIAEGLESACSFVRRRVAEALPLRRVPALAFRFDPSLCEGTRTLALLGELSDDEQA
jgi:ribosome-binding factor A